jgi:hypothetical protein
LDAVGRCSAEKRLFKAVRDILGRVWTARRVLHHRRAPVRFLSHLPRSPEIIWAAVIWRAACFARFDRFDPNASIERCATSP